MKSPPPRKIEKGKKTEELKKMREEAAKRREELRKQVEQDLQEKLRKAEEEDEARIKSEEEKAESFEEGVQRIKGKAKGSPPAKVLPHHILRGMSKKEWTAQGPPKAIQERVDN